MVNRNEVLEDNVPSLTEIVIVLVPKALVTGVIATVRLLPAPPNTIFALGTRLVLEEVAPGLTPEDVQKATEARLTISPNLKTMER